MADTTSTTPSKVADATTAPETKEPETKVAAAAGTSETAKEETKGDAEKPVGFVLGFWYC
jgi:hypothetical protein